MRKYPYDLQYKILSDYALAAKMYKNGYIFKRVKGLVSEFSLSGFAGVNNIEACRDAKNVQRKILGVPGFFAELSFQLRLRATERANILYNKR